MAFSLKDLVSGIGDLFSGRSRFSGLAGAGLIGAGSFFDKEPGFAVEARQSLRNLFTNPPSMQFNQPLAPPLQTSSDFLTNFINTPTVPSAALGTSTDYLRGLVTSPTDPTAPGGAFSRYLPGLQQQESDVLERLKQRYSRFFPAGIAAPSGAELSQAGQVSARFAQNRQALIADLLREQQARQIQASQLLQNVPGIEDIPTGRRLQATGLLENIPGIQDIYQQNQIRAAEDLLGYAKPNPLGAAISQLGASMFRNAQNQTRAQSVIDALGKVFGAGGAGTSAVNAAIKALTGLSSDINLPPFTFPEPGGSPTSSSQTSPEGFPRADFPLPGQPTQPGPPTGAPPGQPPGAPPGAATPQMSFQELASQLLTGLGGLQGTGQTSPTGDAPGKGPGIRGPAIEGASIGGVLGGVAGGAEGGAVLGPVGAVIGAGLGALTGLIGQSQAHKAQKEFFRMQDVDSQTGQVQEIGSFFTQGLHTLGVDTTAYQQFVSDQLSIVQQGATPFTFDGISDTQDQQQAVAEVGGKELLKAIQRGFPQVKSLNDVPGLRAQYIDFLLRNTFTAPNSSVAGGPAVNQIEGPWSALAGF